MTAFRLALLNLIRKKLSTSIALLSIAISVACGGVLLRLYLLSGSRFESLAHAGEAVVGAKAGGLNILLGSLNLEGPYPDFIPAVLYQSLASQQLVTFSDGHQESPKFIKAIIPMVIFARYKGYRVLGTDENFLNRPANSDDKIGLAQGVWASEAGQIVLGSEVAEREGLKVGEKVVVDRWNGLDDEKTSDGLTIVGILTPTHSAWDRGLYSNLQQARLSFESEASQARTPWKSEVLHYFLIYLEPNGFPALQNLINRRTVAQAIYVPQERQRLRELTGTGRSLGLLMTALILLLGGLAVAAMMVVRFDALDQHLGVLRALGFTRGEISGWLLWEGLLLGVVACAVGAGLDFSFFPLTRHMLGAALPPNDIGLVASFPIWTTAIFASLVSAALPLFKLYSQDIHQTLKGL